MPIPDDVIIDISIVMPDDIWPHPVFCWHCYCHYRRIIGICYGTLLCAWPAARWLMAVTNQNVLLYCDVVLIIQREIPWYCVLYYDGSGTDVLHCYDDIINSIINTVLTWLTSTNDYFPYISLFTQCYHIDDTIIVHIVHPQEKPHYLTPSILTLLQCQQWPPYGVEQHHICTVLPFAAPTDYCSCYAWRLLLRADIVACAMPVNLTTPDRHFIYWYWHCAVINSIDTTWTLAGGIVEASYCQYWWCCTLSVTVVTYYSVTPVFTYRWYPCCYGDGRTNGDISIEYRR